MIFHNPLLFEEAGQELLPHLAHRISIVPYYGGGAEHDGIAVECADCHEILIDFLPDSTVSGRPDPDKVRYEGHYDSARDVCYAHGNFVGIRRLRSSAGCVCCPDGLSRR